MRVSKWSFEVCFYLPFQEGKRSFIERYTDEFGQMWGIWPFIVRRVWIDEFHEIADQGYADHKQKIL